MSLPSSTNTLLVERESGWVTIWLNRPEARNALSDEMSQDLYRVFEIIKGDASIRGVTLRGKGGVFCAGGDLKGFQANYHSGGQARDEVIKASRGAGELFQLINHLPQVVVILVEGAAMAGGLGIVCCADVVAVTQDAKFALTETSIGLPPAQIAPYIVQRLGLRIARRIMLTGARFNGTEAADIGIADYVVSDPTELEALEAKLKRSVRRCAPGANAVTKELVLAAPNLPIEDMIERAAVGFADCMLSEEGSEGVASFIEKRKPIWAEES